MITRGCFPIGALSAWLQKISYEYDDSLHETGSDALLKGHAYLFLYSLCPLYVYLFSEGTNLKFTIILNKRGHYFHIFWLSIINIFPWINIDIHKLFCFFLSFYCLIVFYYFTVSTQSTRFSEILDFYVLLEPYSLSFPIVCCIAKIKRANH